MSDYDVMITCAVTGSTLSPSMSPYLPVTPEQIVDQSVEAVKAGASILHLHARDPRTGEPTNDLAVWDDIVTGIRQRCDAVINMSASLGKTAEDRLSAVLALRPEIATVIVGSMNYGLFRKPENQGVNEFKLEWEKQAYGPKSYEIVTRNSFATIDRMISTLIEHDIGIEFEIYDVGHLYILEHHLRTHSIRKPMIIQFLTGILGGIASEIDHILHLKRTAERLFGNDVSLFMHGTGRGNIRTAVYGAMMGTNLRVGQEDNLFDRLGVPFRSNAEQVGKVAGILKELNIGVATIAEARSVLNLGRQAMAAAD
jgi:uncharacterized protein (DUF849 family)